MTALSRPNPEGRAEDTRLGMRKGSFGTRAESLGVCDAKVTQKTSHDDQWDGSLSRLRPVKAVGALQIPPPPCGTAGKGLTTTILKAIEGSPFQLQWLSEESKKCRERDHWESAALQTGVASGVSQLIAPGRFSAITRNIWNRRDKPCQMVGKRWPLRSWSRDQHRSSKVEMGQQSSICNGWACQETHTAPISLVVSSMLNGHAVRARVISHQIWQPC